MRRPTEPEHPGSDYLPAGLERLTPDPPGGVVVNVVPGDLPPPALRVLVVERLPGGLYRQIAP